MHDLVTVKTALRPDYHEYFPLFRADELVRRLSWMPPFLATLMIPKNMAVARDILPGDGDTTFRGTPARLREVLQRTGFSAEIARAITLNRWRYFPTELRTSAYLNESYVINESTALSAPGAVALTLER